MSLQTILKNDQTHNVYNDALKNFIDKPGPGLFSCNNKKKPGEIRKKSAQRQATHYLMRGGSWTVPNECLDSFLWHYAVSMQQNHEWSIVERRTPLFRYHVDLDFNEQEQVQLETLHQYLCVIQDTLRLYFPYSDNVHFECKKGAAALPP